jgi:hypothetical protein
VDVSAVVAHGSKSAKAAESWSCVGIGAAGNFFDVKLVVYELVASCAQENLSYKIFVDRFSSISNLQMIFLSRMGVFQCLF